MVSHPLQTPAWEEFRRRMGIDAVQTHGLLVTFHKIPFTPWTIGYFPKGPAPSQKMIQVLFDLGIKKHAIFIQLEPNVTGNFKFQISNFKLIPSHHPLFTKYTFILDLTKSEDELLAAMHPKTRYNIKVAQKHGVEVKEDNNAFEKYLALTKETTSRQGFYAHDETYHRTMWDVMHNAGIAHLFTASYQGTVLSSWIVFVWGDTVYYPYGASSRQHREVMAPTLMLWEIAKWAKQKGLKKFDLWGAMGPDPDKNNPWYGFHRFKEGFGPKLVTFAGSFDLVINTPLYKFYIFADTIRWGILHGITTIRSLF